MINRISLTTIRNFQDYLNLYVHHYQLKYFDIISMIMPLRLFTLQGVYYAYKLHTTLKSNGCDVKIFKPTDSDTKHRPPLNLK